MHAADMLSLAEYNRWANERIYRRAVHVEPAELHAAHGQTHRTIYSSFLHLADAQWFWRVLCETGQTPGQELKPDDFAGLDDLRAFAREEDDRLVRFANTLTDAQLNRAAYLWMASGEAQVAGTVEAALPPGQPRNAASRRDRPSTGGSRPITGKP